MRNLFELYDKLIELASSDEKIDFAGSFPDWAVVGVGGSLGLSMSTEGKSREPLTSLLNNPLGMKICDASHAIKSWNFEEASLALAAVNAVLNTKERLSALGCYEPYKNYSTRGLTSRAKPSALSGTLNFRRKSKMKLKKSTPSRGTLRRATIPTLPRNTFCRAAILSL